MPEKKKKNGDLAGDLPVPEKNERGGGRKKTFREINILMFSISILPDIYVLPEPILNYCALNKTYEIFKKKKISRIFPNK